MRGRSHRTGSCCRGLHVFIWRITSSFHFHVFSVFSSVQLYLMVESWWRREARALLRVPRVPRGVPRGGRGVALQAQRAPVRRRESVQDVRSGARVGVGLLRHQHFKQRADLGQEGPAQWAVLLWTFTWEEEEEKEVSLCCFFWELKP